MTDSQSSSSCCLSSKKAPHENYLVTVFLLVIFLDIQTCTDCWNLSACSIRKLWHFFLHQVLVQVRELISSEWDAGSHWVQAVVPSDFILSSSSRDTNKRGISTPPSKWSSPAGCRSKATPPELRTQSLTLKHTRTFRIQLKWQK